MTNKYVNKFEIGDDEILIKDYSLDNSNIVSVKDFGAVGDGIVDDTQAFKDAISSGDIIYCPNGTYLITETLDIPSRKQLIGNNLSKLKNGIQGMTLLKMYSHSIAKDLILDGNESNANADVLIYIFQNGVKIENITTIGGANAIHVGDAEVGTKVSTGWIQNCNITQFSDNGIKFFASNDVYVSDTIVNCGSAHTSANDLSLNWTDICQAHIFTNCEFIGGANALLIGQSSVKYCKFNNCFFDSATRCLINNGDSNTFVNCWFSNRGTAGVQVFNAKNTKFIGCTFKNCSTHGIITNTDSVSVIGCEFTANETSGIRINNCTKLIINGCVFSDDVGYYTQTRGIEGTPTSAIITNNVLKNQGAIPSASANVIVNNNLQIT